MSVATDYKIVGNTEMSGTANELRVGAQPTVLRGTAAQNKQAFDNYCDLIATKHNDLCDFINNQASSEAIDQSVRAFYHDVLGWSADD